MSELDFDFPADDAEEETQQEQSNAQQAQARLDREKAKLKKELEELRAFKIETEAKLRQQSVAETLQQAGLQPEWAEFYKGEDTTPEAVKAWAVAKKFIQPSEDEPEPEAVEPPTAGFTPTVVAEANMVGSKFYSAEEFAALQRNDPKKAERVYQAGRLKKEEVPWSYSSRLYGRDT